MIRAAVRPAVVAIARRWPSAFYGAVGLVARATGRFGREEYPVSHLEAAFPLLATARLSALSRRRRESRWKSIALGFVLAHSGRAPAFPVIDLANTRPVTSPPAILVSFYLAAVAALGQVLARTPGEILVLHRMGWNLPPNVTDVYVDADEGARIAAFHLALAAVRSGGTVFLVVDGRGRTVPFLGGTILLERGPLALARLTGVPIVPLLARWSGARVEVEIGERIPAEDDEAALAVRVARCFERYLTQHPSEIDPPLLARVTQGRVPSGAR